MTKQIGKLKKRCEATKVWEGRDLVEGYLPEGTEYYIPAEDPRHWGLDYKIIQTPMGETFRIRDFDAIEFEAQP